MGIGRSNMENVFFIAHYQTDSRLFREILIGGTTIEEVAKTFVDFFKDVIEIELKILGERDNCKYDLDDPRLDIKLINISDYIKLYKKVKNHERITKYDLTNLSVVFGERYQHILSCYELGKTLRDFRDVIESTAELYGLERLIPADLYDINDELKLFDILREIYETGFKLKLTPYFR